MAVFAAAAHKKVEVPEISFDFKANMLSSNYWKTAVIMYKIYYAAWWTAGFTLKFVEKKSCQPENVWVVKWEWAK